VAYDLYRYPLNGMPEGPSLVILKEALQKFTGKKILHASGNAKIDMPSLEGKRIVEIRTWGKHLFIVLKDVCVRIHLLMFGTYSINEQIRADRSVRLQLSFKNDELFFYTCAVRLLDISQLGEVDWAADVMSDEWSPVKARNKLKKMKDELVCDVLLNQQVFSGVGNIIKNEVLYRVFIHPESRVGSIPSRKLGDLIRESRNYSFDFLQWKKAFVLKKQWLAHTKKTCRRCDLPFVKKYCGKTKRRSFFCERCQVKY
jgi:endonuclease-8